MHAFRRHPLARLAAIATIGLEGFANLKDGNGGAEPPQRSRPKPDAGDEPDRPRRSLAERKKLLARKLGRGK